MQLFKNTALLSVSTIISQLLGIVRDKLLISIVGVGVMLDIYNASFKIPDLVISILVSFVGITVIVPYLISSLVKDDKDELNKKVSTLFFFFNMGIIVLSLLIISTLDLYLKYVFPKFTPDDLTLLSSITKLMLIQPILLGTSNLLICVAQAYKNFAYYAAAPILYNLGVIGGVYYLYDDKGVYGLVYGVLIGASLHLLAGFIFIIRAKVKIRLRYYEFRYIREILPIAGWRSIAFIMMSLKHFSLTVFAGLMGAGIISAFTFALNLVNMCVQFFATSYSMAVFPTLSEYYENGELDKLRSIVKRNALEIFAISTLFAIIVYVFAELIVQLIYNSNRNVLTLFYIGILAVPFLSLEQYYARVFMAIHKVKVGVTIHVISFLSLIIILYTFYAQNYDYRFLMLGYLINSILVTGLLYYFMRIKSLSSDKN